MKRYLFLLAIIPLGLVLAACGSSEPAAPEQVSYTIEMTEYAFTPNEIDVSVGQEITLTLVNKGQLQHEIMFGRDMETADGRPNGYAVDLFEFAGVEPVVRGGMLMIDGEMAMDEGDAGHDEEMDDMAMADDDHTEDEEMHMDEDGHGHDGLMVMLPKTDDTATMTFLVTEEMVGTWEIGCFELDGVHYDSGMTGTLTVSDS